jgi:DNA-binding beta-propeller fold protein YncE
MATTANLCLVTATLLGLATTARAAEIPDELRIKTEQVFEFTARPTVTWEGDKVAIRFASKGFCDATVAIEDTEGKIVRHLASGVLGPKAPVPFQMNAKEQTVIWDGKDDKGEYVDDKAALTVRVSLGLKPRYEKSLFWEPRKRVSGGTSKWVWTDDILAAPRPEGVYVFDGNGVDHVRLFDHEGIYERTIYPFPADKLRGVKGLKWQDYPHGYSRPAKNGLNQTTFFTSGGVNGYGFALPAAFAMAVGGDRIALVKLSLNRLFTDGSSGGLDIGGPQTWLVKGEVGWAYAREESRHCPYSAAFSPDGKRVYLAGYSVGKPSWFGKMWLGGVACVDYDGDASARPFVGDLKPNSGLTPSVACDSQGRVYVADFIHDAVQVYDSDAKLLKGLPVNKPTSVAVNPKTGEIYVFSWHLGGPIWSHPDLQKQPKVVPTTLTVLKSADDPAVVASYGLSPWITRTYKSDGDGAIGDSTAGTEIRVAVDFWTDPVTIWVTAGGGNFVMVQPKDGKLELKRDFGKDIAKSVKRIGVNAGHQRLYVNPASRKLYVTENEWWVGGGSFHNLIEIDPDTGKIKQIPLPVQWVEDMTFDIDGLAYLRQVEPQHRVVRYDPATWREVPWDYGEEGLDAKGVKIESGLPLPSEGTGYYSQGGLSISPRGHLAVWCATPAQNLTEAQKARKSRVMGSDSAKPYQPRIYPGRGGNGCIHMWDKHGKLVIEDAAQGASMTDGLGIDRDDNLYLLSWIPRVFDGITYFNKISGTVIKVRPGKSKWLLQGGGPIPLPESDQPKRSADISGYTLGTAWVEGADWFYGGAGNCSFKTAFGCICWQQSRMTLDYFARSFAPETDQFSVAALDSNGNLILRIGRYGNADDGMPAMRNAERGMRSEEAANGKSATANPKSEIRNPKLPDGPMLVPPQPRSIGGDEVALMQPSHVATLSDRYLYIGDVGNGRIVQVKLGYHAEEKVALKEMKHEPK